MDLFGTPTLTTVQQEELFRGPVGPRLADHEATARETIARLRHRVESQTATPAQLELYREALALLRRHLAYNDEEMRVRIRLGR